MKQAIGIVIFVLAFQFTFGQSAIIQDEDGWTNVRKNPDGQSEIIHKIKENEVFWYDYEPTDILQDWVSIYIPKNDFCLGKSEPNFIVGYIHKSRLLPLDSLVIYEGNDFSFKYSLSDFDTTDRIIDKDDGKWVVAIDGRPVWGTDGDLPKTQVNNIEILIEGEKIIIHKAFFSDISECDNSFNVYKNGDTFLVHQWNSDGAGAYEIVWVFSKNGLKQRLVGTII